MIHYDFKVLQYNEFECLTRDLLQAEFGFYLESFKDGRDEGIDLRFAEAKGGKAIIQVKRYKEFKELYTTLKKEVVKVKKLNPSRYLLSTSVGLTPQNKEVILQLFTPYIHTPADIFGRDDLNNILGKHPKIEEKYYKLWLSSTKVLQQIVNKDVVNWSNFELERIKEQISLYVQNESFSIAYDILRKNRYVIISGIPGIGKTTLARMLAYNILADGYDEFVYITDSLSDGVKLFQKGKSQIFFFDDFLGSNVFEPSEKNFDKKLVSFIETIQREKNKVFILTTREYILSEAKNRYERFNTSNIEIAKCTIDLSSYTKYIKACILYNHLATANLPTELVEQILENKSYISLIKHPNFNPRIIETYIDSGLWRKYKPDQFMRHFVAFFDKPSLVWEQAFESLNIQTRYALLVFASMGGRAYVEDWATAYAYFCSKTFQVLGCVYESVEWKRSVKILQDCFININKEDQQLVASFFNPSVLDFLKGFLNENLEVQRSLIRYSYFVEQLYKIFRDTPQSYFGHEAYIIVDENLFPEIVARFEFMMNNGPKSCEVVSSFYKRKRHNERYDQVLFYNNFYECYPKLLLRNKGLLEKYIDTDNLTCQCIYFSKRVQLVPLLDWSLIPVELETIVEQMIEEDPKDLPDFCDLLKMLEKIGMKEQQTDKHLLEKIEDEIYSEINNNISSVNDANDLEDVINDILQIIPYEEFSGCFLDDLDNIRNSYAEPDYEDDDDLDRSFSTPSSVDDVQIEEMMTSLRRY